MGDRWSRWLLGGREGGDKQVRARLLQKLGHTRDQVLERAAITPGDVVLDVGAGDGLIAFGALELVGPTGRVIFSDVSSALLEEARRAAQELEVADRCTFLECGAEDLSQIPDGSVDVATTRSVLIYVSDKARAFSELYRVLRPGGRISIWEPINRLMFPEPRGRFFGYDVREVQELADKLSRVWQSRQQQMDAMMDFDDRDLWTLAEQAGFLPLHLELRRDLETELEPRSWQAFSRSSPNPLAPSLEEAIREGLDADDARRLTEHLRPQVEAGQRRRDMAIAHVWGQKP